MLGGRWRRLCRGITRSHFSRGCFVSLDFFRINLGVATETVLHVLELVNAVDTLGLGFGENEAAECLLEFLATWAIGHAAKTGAIPVDLSRPFIESGLFLFC